MGETNSSNASLVYLDKKQAVRVALQKVFFPCASRVLGFSAGYPPHKSWH